MKAHSILLIAVAFASCSRQSPSLPSNTFTIKAPEATHEGSMSGTSLMLTADRDATVSLDADGKHLSLLVSGDSKPPHEATLVLAAGAAPSSSRTDSAQVLLRIKSAGSDVGAPCVYPLPAGTTLSEFFTSSVSAGTYPLGKPIVVGTLNSKPILLTVSNSP